MSFPSVALLTQGRSLAEFSPSERLDILSKAWQEDCQLAFSRLKESYHQGGKLEEYDLKNQSELHMQMLRTFASTAIREGVLPKLFPNMRFDFLNCCADIGSDAKKPLTIDEIVILQIQFQNGERAYADC